MVNFLAEDPLSPFAIHHSSFTTLQSPVKASSSFWQPSLDPKNEERMPSELKHWRRWSNHFDKEADFRLMDFDMGSECTNCGSTTWELIDSEVLRAIQCRTCGHTPTETRNSYHPSTRLSDRFSKTLPAVYTEEIGETSEGDSVFSNMTEASGIVEHDFASPNPRHLSSHTNTGIQSVRQSMIQPAPKTRWFESNKPMTFQFRLTPRGKATSAPSASAATTAPSASSATTSSSRPPGAADKNSTRGIPIHEMDDETAWQRLLTSALFLMKEEHIPAKEAPPKIIDLGLLNSRAAGGKHLAMAHHSSKDHEAIMQNEKREAKRILWKVVVKPAGARAKISKIKPADEHGNYIE